MYHAKSSLFLRKYSLYDQHGLELMQISRPFSLFSMNFKIHKFDEYIAEINKASNFFSNNLNIQSINGTYFAQGNFRANDFTLYKEDDEVAKISRHGVFKAKQYGVAVLDSEDPLLILSIVLAIEMMIRVKRSRKG